MRAAGPQHEWRRPHPSGDAIRRPAKFRYQSTTPLRVEPESWTIQADRRDDEAGVVAYGCGESDQTRFELINSACVTLFPNASKLALE
jgi:hypothetical protein